MRCAQALDTGAYVLGALAPVEREAYERHLAGCVDCRHEVAQLAVLPGLLARLEPALAEAIARDGHAAEVVPKAPQHLLPQTLRVLEVRRNAQRRRRRWLVLSGVVAAACLAVAAGVAAETLDDNRRIGPSSSVQQTPVMVAMRERMPVPMPVPMAATVALVPMDGGTQVFIHCWYPHTVNSTTEKWTMHLVVVPRGGAVEEITSWTASDGDDVTMREFTRTPITAIDKVEVRFDNDAALVYEPT